LPVWVKRGVCSADSLINLALLCLGFLPGLVHAWYIILKYPDDIEYERVAQNDHERGGHHGNGGTTVYYVAHGRPQHPSSQQQGYGTVGSTPSAQFHGQQSGRGNAFAGMGEGQQAGQQGHGKDVRAHVGVAGEGVGADANGNGEGSGAANGGEPSGPPPTYAEVIKGDHKVQKP